LRSVVLLLQLVQSLLSSGNHLKRVSGWSRRSSKIQAPSTMRTRSWSMWALSRSTTPN